MQLIGCFPQHYLPVDLKLSLSQNHLENLSNHGLLVPTCRVSDSVGLGSGQKIFIACKFPGDTDAAGLWTVI